ncbi:ras and Rab interactor 2-like [Arapaima gigas]
MAKTRETSSSKNFFKLIDRLAWEIRDLKQEMVQVNVPFDRTLTEARQQGLEGKPGGVPLPPPVPPRNFDFHFVHRHVSVVDRLTQTHPVWLLLDLGDEEAVRILQPRPPGAFVVRRSSKLLKKVLSLRLDDTSEKPVHDFPVMETRSSTALYLSLTELTFGSPGFI